MAAEKERQTITDPRFASAHRDPRFRRIPKRETKVAIDKRFQSVFTDKRFSSASAPVDKRGKRRSGTSGKDSLREYYRIEEEGKQKKLRKEDGDEGGSEEDSEEEIEGERAMSLKRGRKLDSSSEEESGKEEQEEEDDKEGPEEESTSDEEEEEEADTEEEDEVVYEDWIPELAEENVPEIERETRRLAVVNMDWRHVSATDLYVMLSSFLPKNGQILSVSVYPSEFGLQRMKEEEMHGPVGLFDGDKKKEDDDGDDGEDEDIINQKLRAYEISRLRYYYAVVECDSSATADYLYKACDGVEFERSSNKLDLRFIPDSMEFKHPPRDFATEAPAKYEGLDFQSRALQLSKVNLSWDEDEPHRAKTLKRKFKAEQMAELELKEFLASDESESDDDDQPGKKEKKKEKYRALIHSGDNDSDEGEEVEEEDNYQDMEVTFNTELENLGKRILEKKDKKSETVWEAYLRKRREKKKARKNKHKKDSSSASSDDDDDDYGSDSDQEVIKGDGDDFFVEEPPLERKKGKKKQGDKAEKEAEEEASRAELELLLADENDGGGGGVKGYNIKRKVKKGKKAEIAEEKIPAGDLDDPRFSALFTSPLFSLDPTDPQFKRSAVYARQLVQKQKGEQRSLAGVELAKATAKPEVVGAAASKKEKQELSSAIRSVKMKIKQQQAQWSSGNGDVAKREQGGGRRGDSSSLVQSQRVKKKAKVLG